MSGDQAENESESSLPTFRPFTREELAIIENRISEKKLAAKKKQEKLARNIAVRIDSTYVFRGRERRGTTQEDDETFSLLLSFFEVC